MWENTCKHTELHCAGTFLEYCISTSWWCWTKFWGRSKNAWQYSNAPCLIRAVPRPTPAVGLNFPGLAGRRILHMHFQQNCVWSFFQLDLSKNERPIHLEEWKYFTPLSVQAQLREFQCWRKICIVELTNSIGLPDSQPNLFLVTQSNSKECGQR